MYKKRALIAQGLFIVTIKFYFYGSLLILNTLGEIRRIISVAERIYYYNLWLSNYICMAKAFK